MSSAAIFGLIWLGITLLSMLAKAANKNPKQQGRAPQGRPQKPASFGDFVRDIEQAQRPQARPVARARRVRVAPPEPRVRAAPRPAPEALTQHHLHSALEQPRDLSDVDERHLRDHVRERERSTGPGLPHRLQTQIVQSGPRDEPTEPRIAEFKAAQFAAHLTPLQRAFVLGELLHKSPAFEMQSGQDSDNFL